MATKEPAKYEIITLDDGTTARQYPDGSVRDNLGRLVKQHPAGVDTQITSTNAAAYARSRWEKFREAAADAIAAEVGSIVPGIKTPEHAWGVLNARTASAIMDSEKPRGDDLRILGQNMGATPRAYELDEQQKDSETGLLAALGAELVQHLTKRAQEARENDEN